MNRDPGGLGDKAKARETYDKASAWIEKNKPQTLLWERDVAALQPETAGLLGIEDEPK